MAIISAEKKRFLRRIDFALLFASIGIIIYSLIVISSATHVNTPGEERYWFVQRQGIFAVVNVLIAILFLNFDYRGLQQYGKQLYIFNLIMLAAVMFFGHSALGAQRWIQIGPVSLQPSEFSKLIMIVCLASILENKVGQLNSLQDLLPVALYIGVPFLLVLKQPDLGTSLVFMAIFFGMIIICGIRWKILFGICLAGIASMPLIWQFLKDYQKMRIMVFLDPNVDPLGSGYHIIQSKIAIGSGMIFGKGLFEGTQSQLNFLPENHTDFIFAVVGEELGFIGAVNFYSRFVHCKKCQRYFRQTFGCRNNFNACISRPCKCRNDYRNYAGHRNSSAAYELWSKRTHHRYFVDSDFNEHTYA